MLVLLIGFLIFFWLLIGSVQYLICIAVPRLRRYALSAALWWAVCGPCSVGFLLLAEGAIVAQALIAQDHAAWQSHAPHLLAGLGWGYLTLGVLGSAAVATVFAWLHHLLVSRFTFALFRLYAMAVSAGIGSVFGWCFSWWILGAGVRYGWILGAAGMLVLVFGFGIAAYRNARSLRGEAPTEFAWVTRQEFEGV